MPKFCRNCGAPLADGSAFCSACGTSVALPECNIVGESINPTQAESAQRPLFYRFGLAIAKHPFISVFAILIVCVLISYTPPPSGGPVATSTVGQYRSPQIDSYIPPLQGSFTSMIESFIPSYKSADTEVRKTNVRFERKTAIIQYFSRSGGLRFHGWVGELQDLRTESDGRASFSVKLKGSKTAITTWNNSLSDSWSNTMISRNDALYPSLMYIKNGDEVTVSGTFIVEGMGQDYIREASLTEDGSMTSPEFIVRFSQISKYMKRLDSEKASAQASDAENVTQPSVPAVTVTRPNRVLELTASNGVCRVDYLNAPVSDGEDTVPLRAGKYEGHEQHEGESSVEVKLLSCLDRGVAEHALLATDWVSCGANCNSHEIVQVFELRGGHPVLVQQINFNSDATGTGVTFDDNSLTLTITGRSSEESPHCCPTSLDVVTYRWERHQFVHSGYKRVPVPPRS